MKIFRALILPFYLFFVSLAMASDSPCDEGICLLPAEVGICRAMFIRYAFKQDEGKCASFTYGGCQGNANNFETLEECEKKCQGCLKETGQETE